MKVILNEDEKNQISSQHEEIDSTLFNFLMRRVNMATKRIGGAYNEVKPLEVIEYTFDGFPGYGFNSFYGSKKDVEKRIIDLLYENDIIDFHPTDLNERDPKRVKLTKTIRKFLNFILTK